MTLMTPHAKSSLNIQRTSQLIAQVKKMAKQIIEVHSNMAQQKS